MKNLTIVIFENDLAVEKHYDEAFDKYGKSSTEKEILGVWGEILSNADEVLSTISDTVNYFINDTDKTEIVFGCCRKDYDDIIAKIDVEKYIVKTLLY